MDGHQEAKEWSLFCYVILATDDFVFLGADGESRRRGIQTQGLSQDGVEVFQLGEMLICYCLVTDHSVDLLLCLAIGFGILEEFVEHKRKKTGSGLMS